MKQFRPAWFVFFWLVINLLQAAFTELTSDEGYYWFYSLHLQWGYYDHPPMLALLIKAGYALFPNEFGVRLFNVILNAWAVFIFLHLLPPAIRERKYPYFFLAAMPLFHYLSFIVFPDGPLLFFTMTFIWCYKKFITKNSPGITVLLGVITSLMLYSKYHAVLVLAFTVLSNFSLLKNKNFYLAMSLAAILFVPHLVWQYNHDFITFQYHLHQREAASSSNRVFEYISQQVLAIGPGLIFIPFVYKTSDQFEKTLLYLALGTIAFFLVVSINTFVHFHWTSIAIFPLFYLSIKYYYNKKRRLIIWLLWSFCILSFLFRLQLVYQLFPINHVGVDYYHGRHLWANDVHTLAGNAPVIFENNFRESALYSFYSGQTGVALFSADNRKTQYDLWHYEDSLQQKNIFLFKKDSFPGCNILITGLGKASYYTQVGQFVSYYNIPVRVKIPRFVQSGAGQPIEVSIDNPRDQVLTFSKNPGRAVILFCRITGENKSVDIDLISFSVDDTIAAGGTKTWDLKFDASQLKKGKYNVLIGIRNPPMQDSFNTGTDFTIR